jgi:hypothetical protein
MFTIDYCEDLVKSAHSASTKAQFHEAVSPLLDVYKILSFGIGRASTHWRARIIERDRYDRLADIDYPPKELVKRPGRMNGPGDPYFYVSTTAETAVAEVLPEEGQLVQVAGFRLVPDKILQLICVGEYQSVYKRGYTAFNGTDPGNTIGKILSRMSLEERQMHLFIDSFLADVISDSRARDNEYLYSRALRDLLFSRIDAHGITFPSARDAGGANFAVKPAPSDELYHNVCCMIVRVGKRRRYGPLELDSVGIATGLTSDRKHFVWSGEERPKHLVMYNMTKDEYERGAVASAEHAP